MARSPESNFMAKLGAPASRALTGAGYTTLEQLSHTTEDEIKHLHGIGPTALKALREALAEHGLVFAPGKK